jgi:DNA-binding transcriptional ArsR family regulator
VSIAALNWAWSQECPNASAKLVLLALADKANEDGECWPGMDTVADMAGVSTRQVSTHLANLEDAGLIVRKRRRSRAGRLGRYTFHLNLTSGSTLPVDQEKSTSGSAPPVEADDQWKPDVPTTGSPASSTTGSLLPVKEQPPKSNHQGTTNTGKRKRSPEVPLPDDWEPTDDHRKLAAKLGSDLAFCADQFRDHAAANDRRQRDWDAAFRTWLRNDLKFGGPKRQTASTGGRRAGVTFHD